MTRSQVAGDEIVIRGNDVNHIKNVLRMSCGDEISVSDGCGRDYFCMAYDFSAAGYHSAQTGKIRSRSDHGKNAGGSWNDRRDKGL